MHICNQIKYQFSSGGCVFVYNIYVSKTGISWMMIYTYLGNTAGLDHICKVSQLAPVSDVNYENSIKIIKVNINTFTFQKLNILIRIKTMINRRQCLIVYYYGIFIYSTQKR